jgi:hypothetical protein
MPVDYVLMIAFGSLALGFLIGRGTASRSRADSRPNPNPIRIAAPITQEVEAQVKAILDDGRKIEALKALRNATNLGLKEAKDIVDAMANGTYQSASGVRSSVRVSPQM